MLSVSLRNVSEHDDMAKKKAAPPGPKTLFAVKGTDAWFEWLKEYAEFASVSAMSAIDLALKGQAKRDGFDKPMPRRIGKATGKGSDE
jgi:hypothetical protein